MFWLKIVSWLSGLDIGTLASKAVDAYSKAKDTQVALDQHDKDLAAKQVEAVVRQAALDQQLKIGMLDHPFSVVNLFGYVTLAYYAWILIYDKILGTWTMHRTDELTGWVANASLLVLAFFFSMKTVLGAIAAVRGRS